MKPAKLLLPVQDRPDMEAIADTAFVLAARFGAQVEGVFAYTPPNEQIQLYYDAAAPAYHDSLLKDAEARIEAAKRCAKEIFDQFAKRHGKITSKFVTMKNGAMTGVAQRARLSDLTVIGISPAENSAAWLDIRDAAIFQSGRPVVVAPGADASQALGETLIIAWKDNVEAARAVSAAAPFLAAAKTVHVVSVGRDAVSLANLKEVRAYLSLHAKTVKAEIIANNRPDSAELLLEEAAKHAGGLLVMGAYSQWRWKEWIFGGVTKHILEKTTLPVLMAH